MGLDKQSVKIRTEQLLEADASLKIILGVSVPEVWSPNGPGVDTRIRKGEGVWQRFKQPTTNLKGFRIK